jgi:TniQ
MFRANVLPIKVMPQEDELLSSWLVRLSIAHGQKLHTFTRLLWNKSGIWARDIDKTITPEQLQVLADRCGVTFDTAHKTTLSDYVGWVYETHKPLGANPWLTTIGIYHRKRIKFGQQFCPKCLSEDARPYFRRHWRLACFTICTKHKIQLFDCCPKCESPVNFHRDELGNYFSFAPTQITRCFNCQLDLRRCEPVENEVTSDEVEFCERLSQTIQNGFWMLTPDRPTHSLAFFAGLRQILKILSMNDRRIKNLLNELDHSSMTDNSERKTIDFPELRVNERRILLTSASKLLKNWSTDFVQISNNHRVWRSLWLRHLEQKRNGVFRASPFWLWETVSQDLDRRKYKPTTAEIAAAIRFLKAANQPVVARRICLLLDNYSQKLKKKNA